MIRLRNSTNISDGTLRKLVNAVLPPSCGRFDVEVRNSSRSYSGRAYTHGSSYHSTARAFVVARLPQDEQFREHARHSVPEGRGYLPVTVGSRIEAAIYLFAHELRHLWQKNHSRGRVWGARGRYSERDTSAYGISMLRKFRRGELDFKPADWTLKSAAPKPSAEDRRAEKLAHAKKMLALAETRAKRANTILKKWQQKVKRYEN